MIEKLNIKQIEQGIEQCIKSAQEILHSANTLKGRESRRIALSLYMLAAEEIGKAVLLYRAILLEISDDKGWKKFWGTFYDHKSKLLPGISSWMSDLFNLDLNPIADWLKNSPKFLPELDSTKQSGFYIIYNEKNSLFEKRKFNYISWDLWSNVVNHRIRELKELHKIGLFKSENLNKLRNTFTSTKGKGVLDDYNQVKDTLPLKQRYSTKEYQELLKENDLNKLLGAYQAVIYKYAKFTNFDRNISLLRRPFIFIKSKIHPLKINKGQIQELTPTKKKAAKKEPPILEIDRLYRYGIYFLIFLSGSLYLVFCTKIWFIFKVMTGIWGVLCLILFYGTVKLLITKIRFPWL